MRVRFRAITKKGDPMRALEGAIEETEKYLHSVGRNVVAVAKIYPPVPTGSRYERTFALQESWKYSVSRTASRLELAIGNYVYRHPDNIRHRQYAPYVQGTAQMWYHEAHGWSNISELLDSSMFRNDYHKHLRDIRDKFVKHYNGGR